MLPPKKRPPLKGDNFLVRHQYEQELHAAELDADADYADWLRSKGIDPETGAMTEAGVAFFAVLVNEQNALNRAKRGHRRRTDRG